MDTIIKRTDLLGFSMLRSRYPQNAKKSTSRIYTTLKKEQYAIGVRKIRYSYFRKTYKLTIFLSTCIHEFKSCVKAGLFLMEIKEILTRY
jgi:hypothetical protein